MEIFDVHGKMVYRKDMQILNGYYAHNFSMAGLADGMFFVNLISSGHGFQERLLNINFTCILEAISRTKERKKVGFK
ncbi:MAG: hypothetical protein IPI23_14935 [Bacteroidetes bacterium]|nr:hypothetical protein [Bacteroidota bacterium]